MRSHININFTYIDLSRYFIRSIIFFLLFQISYISYAQEIAVESENEIEEIEVIEKPFRSLRLELYNNRKKAFSLFNKLNDDNEYDMRCRLEHDRKRGGALQKCNTRYKRIEVQNAIQQADLEYNENSYLYEINWALLHEKDEAFMLKIQLMMINYPDFYDAMSEYIYSMKKFQSARKKDMQSNIFTRD